MNKTVIATVATSIILTVSNQAVANDVEKENIKESQWSSFSSISFVSDFIFRGQSMTWGRPAVQFLMEANHEAGPYVGFFSSNVSDHWLPGANLEIDVYGGMRGSLPGDLGISYDIGGVYYYYPGADWDESGFNPPTCPDCNTKSSKLNTFEVYASLSYKWLSIKAGRTLTEYWGWNSNNSGIGMFANDLKAGVKPGGDTKGSYFYETNLLYEISPTWFLSGQLGRQVIEDTSRLNLTYYKVGIAKNLHSGWSLGVNYSGADEQSGYKNFVSLRNTTSKSDVTKDIIFVNVTKNF